jgi:hypothetical protein
VENVIDIFLNKIHNNSFNHEQKRSPVLKFYQKGKFIIEIRNLVLHMFKLTSKIII